MIHVFLISCAPKKLKKLPELRPAPHSMLTGYTRFKKNASITNVIILVITQNRLVMWHFKIITSEDITLNMLIFVDNLKQLTQLVQVYILRNKPNSVNPR